MMRRLSLLVLSTFALGAVFGTTTRAQAAEAVCAGELQDIDAKREVLEGLQAAIAKGDADRQALADRADALAVAIAGAKDAGEPTKRLATERADVLDELAGLRKLAPAVAAQAAALASEVQADELAYVACVDATL